MKQKNTLKKLFIAVSVALFSLPASAQLSLSAGAKADADTKKGADASAGATGDVEETAAPAAEASDAAATEPVAEPQPEVAPPPPMPEPEPEEMLEADQTDTNGTVKYDGGFVIQTNDGNYKLKINGIVKTRWNLLNDEYYAVAPNGDTGTNHKVHSSFLLPYARLGLSGNFLTPKLGYMIMYDFATSNLIYAYSKWTFVKDKLELQVGRFKRPFARQYLISTAKQMFIDNPLGQMGQAIDVGLQLSNNFTAAKGLEWAIGVFNGVQPGDHLAGRGDFAPAVVGRIGYNNGIKGYSDTDFEGGPLRFGVGLSASTEFDHDDNDVSTHYLEIDGMIKVNGLALSAAAYVQSIAGDGFWDIDDNNTDNGNGTETSGLAAIGTYVQAGYLISNMFEPMARYGLWNGYYEENDLHQAITAGFAIHFFKNHQFKWENNLTLDIQHENDPEDPGEAVAYQDILFASQLQFSF